MVILRWYTSLFLAHASIFYDLDKAVVTKKFNIPQLSNPSFKVNKCQLL